MLTLCLQFFGGRGGKSGLRARGGNGSADGALMDVKPRVIEGTYREVRPGSPSYYKEEILQASTDGSGNLTFTYATPVSREKTAKTNRTQYLTYEVAHGAVNGSTFGINWDKVNSISGQTYNLRQEAKSHGLRWNRDKKRWER